MSTQNAFDISDIFGTAPIKQQSETRVPEVSKPVKAEIITFPQRSTPAKKIYVNSEEEWLEIRKTGIGGSDAGAVCGVNPYRSPVQAWLEKTGKADNFEDNERMFWGRELEDVVANIFARLNGFKVRRNNAILVHPDYDFMLANLDREIVGQEEKTILEVKTASEYTLKNWTEGDIPAKCMSFSEGIWAPSVSTISGNIPEYYQLQVQHYMCVTGATKAYLVVLIGGGRYLQFEIQRDDELINYLIQIESDFWQYVKTNTAPPMDESSLTASTLNMLYPSSNGEQIYLPEEALALVADYRTYGDQEKPRKRPRKR